MTKEGHGCIQKERITSLEERLKNIEYDIIDIKETNKMLIDLQAEIATLKAYHKITMILLTALIIPIIITLIRTI
ncbi:hypothetical protein [Methanothermobacter sp. K4]|jgi:hypothetical protein|nr:hypothetical protein [Methanothermobacter sp. K4]MCG2827726.1 hypothetical protein [Methanothermobacter sp. K4]MCQ8904363.1 hypothetical protein [Methanothermobacter sp.]